MHGECKIKVPGGKMVSVKVDYNKKILSVSILGDFFLHPEGTVYKIEEGLKGMDAASGKNEFADRIANVLKVQNASLIGADANVISSAIEKAIKDGMASN